MTHSNYVLLAAALTCRLLRPHDGRQRPSSCHVLCVKTARTPSRLAKQRCILYSSIPSQRLWDQLLSTQLSAVTELL